MNLNIKDWGTFKVSDLFVVKYGVNLELNTCEEAEDKDSSVNFVARTAENNGVSARVKAITGVVPQDKGLISVAGGGSVLSTFLQPEPFYSGRDLYTLESKVDISDEAKFFIITVIEQNKYKYSYGRQANKTLPDLLLKLPVNEQGKPDYKFMEQYVKRLHHKPLTTKNKSTKVPELNTATWKEFSLNRVFTLKGGFYNKKPEHSQEGKIPFLASTENDNGVTEYYVIDDIYQWNKTGEEDFTLDKKLYKGNCIAVTVNGSVCNAFYQKEEFTCSHDITAFYLNGHLLNSLLGMFLCTVIMKDKYRWSYGRKPHDVKKFGKSIIKLPIQHNADGSPVIDKTKQYSEKGYIPDWQFMEEYIKSLPYGDRL